MSAAQEFTSPVGRMVWGSLYEPNTKDFDGNPLTVKKGPDAGKPTQRYQFGLAVPKTQAHWANEPGWGQLIWQTAFAAFPGGDQSAAMRPDFSWKIEDGDSGVISPKSKSKIAPKDREGFPGHWVLKFSSAYAPKIYDARDANNPVLLEGKDAIVPGYAIQVIGSVAGNTGQSPGIYLNVAAVGLRAYLPEIRTGGVDVTGKFGGALPPGASTVPAAGFKAPAAAPAPAAPPAAYVPPPVGLTVATPAAAPPVTPPPIRVTPAPHLVNVPPMVAPPPPVAAPAPPVVAAPAAPSATHKGIPISSYLAGGWTLDQLRADGFAG